jgi:hypothetical protein
MKGQSISYCGSPLFCLIYITFQWNLNYSKFKLIHTNM